MTLDTRQMYWFAWSKWRTPTLLKEQREEVKRSTRPAPNSFLFNSLNLHRMACLNSRRPASWGCWEGVAPDNLLCPFGYVELPCFCTGGLPCKINKRFSQFKSKSHNWLLCTLTQENPGVRISNDKRNSTKVGIWTWLVVSEKVLCYLCIIIRTLV